MCGERGPEAWHVVGPPGQMRKQLRDLDSRLPMARKLERRRQQTAGFTDRPDLARQVTAGCLAGKLIEHRLWVEQVHLAGPTCHEKLDDGLRPTGEVRLVCVEIVDLRIRNARCAELPT